MCWLFNTWETLLGTNTHWCLTFSAGLFVSAGRLLYSLGEDWLFLARGQVTQEWLIGAGEPAGSQTLSSVVAKVLSAAQSWGTAGSQPVRGCCSVTFWWHRPGEVKEPQVHAVWQQILSELATQGALRALASPQRGQHLCKSTGFTLEIVLLIRLCLTVPQPSHLSQPAGDSSCPASLSSPVAGPWRWGMMFPAAAATAVRVTIHHPCLCCKRHPAQTVLSQSGSNDPGLVFLGPSQICLQWLVFSSASNPRCYYVQFKE